jgi:hypothetical protein
MARARRLKETPRRSAGLASLGASASRAVESKWLAGAFTRALPYSFRAQSFTGRANMEESKAP